MLQQHHQLITVLWISGAIIACSTFIHGVFGAAAGAAILRATARRLWGPLRFLRDSAVLVLVALWLMLAHMIEIWLWAFAFLRLDLFETVETALYFAAISYTTLGFGDVVLPTKWGLLAGAAAANGLLLFGLSAALLVEAGAKLRIAQN
uniref:Potassium channel domain-containing protein n=1 Tax=uncultured bacterium UPO57 TaxID=1776980 RepID=A0A126SYQ1_9BACT|nr:hypothetical protein ISM_16925 [uncultured bacterium UPO57]